jgi:hypothetical protein
MKKLASFALALVFAAATPLLASEAGSWTGWITDDHCGAMGAKAGHKDCAIKCVDKGGKFVFYNGADQKLYQIDNQALAKEHLGYEVTVKGSVEGDAIKVESIEAKK